METFKGDMIANLVDNIWVVVEDLGMGIDGVLFASNEYKMSFPGNASKTNRLLSEYFLLSTISVPHTDRNSIWT
jgi:hypothetical protein